MHITDISIVTFNFYVYTKELEHSICLFFYLQFRLHYFKTRVATARDTNMCTNHRKVLVQDAKDSSTVVAHEDLVLAILSPD